MEWFLWKLHQLLAFFNDQAHFLDSLNDDIGMISTFRNEIIVLPTRLVV